MRKNKSPVEKEATKLLLKLNEKYTIEEIRSLVLELSYQLDDRK